MKETRGKVEESESEKWMQETVENVSGKIKWREGRRKGEEKVKIIRGARRGAENSKVLSKKMISNFNDKILKIAFICSCYPDQDDVMVHCISASHQNTHNHVPIFFFIMVIFNDFCTLNWKCSRFSFQKSGHLNTHTHTLKHRPRLCVADVND